MYSRGIYTDKREDTVSLPQNYSGSAFAEMTSKQTSDTGELKSDECERCEEIAAKTCAEPREQKDSKILGTVKGLLGGNSLFDSITKRIQSVGAEEILLLAVSAFLFFSKEGDKECAIMLILLLFVA